MWFMQNDVDGNPQFYWEQRAGEPAQPTTDYRGNPIGPQPSAQQAPSAPQSPGGRLWGMQFSGGNDADGNMLPNPAGQLTYDSFMAASPQEQQQYFQYAASISPTQAGAALANISNGRDGQALGPEQLRNILSRIDPTLAQAVSSGYQGVMTRQQQSYQDRDFGDALLDYPIAPLLLAGGAGLANALGFGAAAEGVTASGGATAAGASGLESLSGIDLGLESLPFTTSPSLAELGGLIGADGLPVAAAGAAGAGSSGLLNLGAESFAGPATGAIESAPVIGAAGAPEVSAIASGAGPFVPTTFGAGMAGGLSQLLSGIPGVGIESAAGNVAGESFLGPATGTAEAAPGVGLESAAGGASAPLGASESFAGPATGSTLEPGLQGSGAIANSVGAAGTPIASGVASGAGPFVPTSILGATGAGALSNLLAPAPTSMGNASGGGTGPAATTGGGSPLANLLGVNPDLVSVLGGLGAAGLGMAGANQQADAMREIAARDDARIREMMGFGAPYRQRLADLSANPGSYLSSPEVQTSVQQGTDALARALSVRGNPAGSGTALQEIQNYSANQLFGKLGQEKDRLAGFGGLTAYNTAGAQGPNLAPSLGAAQAQGGIYDSLGYGLGQLTQQRSSLSNLLRGLV